MSVASARKFATPSVSDYAIGPFYLLVAAAALFPVLTVGIPPLVDYPAHLAGTYILSSLADDPTLQANYEVVWRPLPNLAMELLALPLVGALGIYGTGKFIVALAILTPVAGVAALRKALYGEVGYAPAIGFLATYNMCLTWGFINLLLTLGLALMLYATWIATRDRSGTLRIVCFGAAAIALYFGHLFAFATYGLLVGIDTLQDVLKKRGLPVRTAAATLIMSGSQFVAPAVLMTIGVLASTGGYMEYGSLAGKMRALMSPFFSVGTAFDFLLAIFAASVLASTAYTGRLTVAPRMRYSLIALIAVAIVMPEWLMQTWLADIRMPVVIALVAVSAVRIQMQPGYASIVMVAAIAALFASRTWDISTRWSQVDRDYAEFRAALSTIPKGSRILPSQPLPEDTPERAGNFPQLYWGLPTIAAIERSAFVPTLFTDPSKQILHASARNEIIDTPYGRPPTMEELEKGADISLRGAVPERIDTGQVNFWTDWPHRFDYAVVLFAQPSGDGIGTLLDPVVSGSYFTIYRIAGGSCHLMSSDVATPAESVCVRDKNAAREPDES